SIPCAFRKHVCFVENINFVLRFERKRVHILRKRPNVIDASIGCGVYFIQVLFTRTKLTREDACDGSFPKTARTCKKVCMSNLLGLNLFLKWLRDLVLSHDFTELLRAVCAIQRLVCHEVDF